MPGREPALAVNFKPLPQSFYQPGAELVAPRLLGHWLIRNTPQGPAGGPIVETEAYLMGDPACHGFIGQTRRNAALYGPPGRAYVYLIYGLHFCFNAVCRPEGQAEAVLVRAIEAQFGANFMRAHRNAPDPRHLTNGPAKLCAALDINRGLDGVDLCDSNSPVFIAKNPAHKPFLRERGPMVVTTRIGITQAAERPLRFYLEGSQDVSRRIKQKSQ
jgi:DNA-3-methyladenine glycosylase